MECKFCSKVCKNNNSLRNHERLCNNNPNKQIIVSNFINYNEKRKQLNIKGKNQFIKAKELGLETPKISDEVKQKISKGNKGREQSLEERKMRSSIMKKTVEKYPESYTKKNVVGRVKNIVYNDVVLKGTWELVVAKWLDENKLFWEHEFKSFEYEWNGTRKYYPDFYLPDFDIFIEVKGYETERDLAKWKSVPNLVVFKLKEINQIKNNNLDPYRLSLITS